ncbi:MAG: alcohol dehydrogenase [Paenibacillus sp.]|jgi:threonine dehydrogenase-like Zn-dependent dehydrogenase|nr:alcohol dehydrogenase [Paenibacillus sp.]
MMRKVLTQSNWGGLAVTEEPVPELKPGELLVEVEASVISAGTELSGLRGKSAAVGGEERWRSFGYQNAGRVIGWGEHTSGFSLGQRVACMGGPYALHGTHAAVPVNLAVPLPDEVSFEEGAFVALAATALQAVRRAELQLGEFTLVMGLGLVGQLTGQLAQIAGTHVLGADRMPLRIEAARRGGGFEEVIGAESSLLETSRRMTRGYGLDCTFICFGGDATEAFKEAVTAMKHSPDSHVNGRVVIVGGATITHRFGAPLGNLDIRSSARTGPGYHDKQYEYGADYPQVFVPWDTKRNIAEIMGWIASGRLNVRDLISHRVPLEQAPNICRMIVEEPEKTLGVVVTMK